LLSGEASNPGRHYHSSGIIIALTQPLPYQDYDIQIDDVVNNCNTLLALRELAGFFSLSFDSLSIFDTYPFIAETRLDDCDTVMSTMSNPILPSRDDTRETPTVVLSAWKSPYPSFEGFKRSNCGNELLVQVSSLRFAVVGWVFPWSDICVEADQMVTYIKAQRQAYQKEQEEAVGAWERGSVEMRHGVKNEQISTRFSPIGFFWSPHKSNYRRSPTQ